MVVSRWFRVVVLGAAVVAVVGVAVLCLPKVAYRIALFVQTGGTYDPIMVNPRHAFTPIPVANSTRTLRGHHGSVLALAFFPDGTHLVSGGDDHTIRIWNLSSGSCRVVEGHDGAVDALAVSNDGTRLISAGADLVARVWNVKDGKMIAQLEGHTAAITGVGFISRDRVITASNDGTVRVWDVNDEQQVAEWEAQETGVRSLSISKGGTRAASIGGDGTIAVWDLAKGISVWRFHPPEEEPLEGQRRASPVTSPSVALSPDGRHLFAIESNGQLAGWDVGQPKPRDTFEGTPNLMCLALSADGEFVAAVSALESSVFATSASRQPVYRSALFASQSPPEASDALTDALKSGKPPTQQMMQQLARETMQQELNRPVPRSVALSPDGSRAAVGLGTDDLRHVLGWDTPKGKPASILLFERPR